jgi:competence protein ComEC
MADAPSSIGQTADGRARCGLAGVPLFHAAWLFATGIILAHWLWIRPGPALIAIIPMAVLCALSAVRAQRVVWFPVAALWFLLGAWCAEMEPHPAPAPVLASFSDGLVRTVEGTVVEANPLRNQAEQNLDEPNLEKPTQRIDLRLATIEQVTDETDAQIPVEGEVRITVRWTEGTPHPFDCGERIRANVRLLLPQTFHDAGTWSRADYLLDQGVTSTATVEALQIDRIARPERVSFKCRLATWQQQVSSRLMAFPAATNKLPRAFRLSKEDAEMLSAMIAGDRTYLNRTMRVGFERTGSFHMLVVSGFHLAIVAGGLFWIASRLRLPRLPATLITLGASLLYALFTGFATPVQRSFWMIALYLVGRLFYRERRPLNVIGFAALCLLTVSPRSLFDSSFQMTLLAVVSIAGIAVPLLEASVHPYLSAACNLRLVAMDVKLPPKLAAFRVYLRMIAGRLRWIANRFIAWMAFPWVVRFSIRIIELVVVSIVVELAMALPMAIDFHRITVLALPVNLFILPLLAVLMPAALLMVALVLIWPAAAVAPAVLVAWVLHAGVGLVHLFGSIRLGDLRVPSPLPVQSAAFWLLLASTLALAHFGVERPWLRRSAWLALLLAASCAVLPRHIERPRNALFFDAFDVGQGDSLLVITPDGKTLLVDAGGFGGGPRQATQDFDIGEEVVSTALWARGIRHLDAVALSHAHSDHMGGMEAVIRNFHPDELWVGDNPQVDPYNELLQTAAENRTVVRSFRAGKSFPFGATEVAVLAPAVGYQPGVQPANNDSLVLRVAYMQTSVLLEGDAEAAVEQTMLADPSLQSTLLKVGHHGSLTSTSPEFLARVAPQWAVISCGFRNRYGHPRQEVLSELEQAQARTYRTDISGASCFVMDGKTATPDYTCGWRGLR